MLTDSKEFHRLLLDFTMGIERINQEFRDKDLIGLLDTDNKDIEQENSEYKWSFQT